MRWCRRAEHRRFLLNHRPRAATTAAAAAAAAARVLHAVAAFDDVGFEGDGTGFAVELEEEPARVAEDGAGFIAAPERGGRGGAVLADGLRLRLRRRRVGGEGRQRGEGGAGERGEGEWFELVVEVGVAVGGGGGRWEVEEVVRGGEARGEWRNVVERCGSQCGVRGHVVCGWAERVGWLVVLGGCGRGARAAMIASDRERGAIKKNRYRRENSWQWFETIGD